MTVCVCVCVRAHTLLCDCLLFLTVFIPRLVWLLHFPPLIFGGGVPLVMVYNYSVELCLVIV